MSSAEQHYTVQLEVFEGPLDLLLRLIEREQMDITMVSLAKVTDQYLAHMAIIGHTRPDEVAEFLVIAARLLVIKSRALLPAPMVDVEEEDGDDGMDLVERLREYKRYKEVSQSLAQLQLTGLRGYARLAPPPVPIPKLEEGSGDVTALLQAMVAVLLTRASDGPVDRVVRPIRISLREKIVHVQQRISITGTLRFGELLAACTSRLEIVVTFLAVLELVRRWQVAARQSRSFGDIDLSTAPEGARAGLVPPDAELYLGDM